MAATGCPTMSIERIDVSRKTILISGRHEQKRTELHSVRPDYLSGSVGLPSIPISATAITAATISVSTASTIAIAAAGAPTGFALIFLARLFSGPAFEHSLT